MLEKLLALLFHSKAAAISGIFLLGTTGALVSATTKDGVTTITITPNSPAVETTASPSPSPLAVSRLATTEPSSSPSSKQKLTATELQACTDQAKARADAMKTVNVAFADYQKQLWQLRSKSDTVKLASGLLGDIRHAAAKAIEATKPALCVTAAKANADDQDVDEDNDEDKDDGDENDVDAKDVKQGHEDGDDKAKSEKPASNGQSMTAARNTKPSITFTGTEPKAIADQAVAAMKVAFDAAKASVPATAANSPKPKIEKSPSNGDHHGTKGDDKAQRKA